MLAYADDLVLITRNKDNLQDLLDAASDAATLIGLEFRPDKCASLSLTYSKMVEGNIAHNTFSVQGKPMPFLKDHEHYRYLGVPIGVMRDVHSIDSLVSDLCRDLESINNSLLSPWQKLDAIRTFIQPSLNFARGVNHLKSRGEMARRGSFGGYDEARFKREVDSTLQCAFSPKLLCEGFQNVNTQSLYFFFILQ